MRRLCGGTRKYKGKLPLKCFLVVELDIMLLIALIEKNIRDQMMMRIKTSLKDATLIEERRRTYVLFRNTHMKMKLMVTQMKNPHFW